MATNSGPMQRIVVGVDPTGTAENAIHVAIELAQRFHAGIELVHAVHHHHGWPEVREEDLEAARRSVRLRLEVSLSGARLAYVDEPHQLIVLAGHPVGVLLERAAANGGAGLIVLGEHQRRGLTDFGSTCRGVLARASCPVWSQIGPVLETRRILVPVDLSDESLRALAAACSWANVLGATITVLHCFASPELYYGHGYPVPGPTYVVDRIRDDARREFEGAMEGFDFRGAQHHVEFDEAHPASQILERQEEHDLIMMGTHGRTGLSAFLMGSVTQAVLRGARIPVVAMRGPARTWMI